MDIEVGHVMEAVERRLSHKARHKKHKGFNCFVMCFLCLFVAKRLMARRGGTWIQRWRVPLGFLCGAAFIFFARPTPRALLIGASVSLLGLAVRAWAAGHIRKNAQLATSGPYAFTRNPLYLGSFLLGLGFTIASGRVVLGLLFAALFLGIYLPVMRVEASHYGGALWQ